MRKFSLALVALLLMSAANLSANEVKPKPKVPANLSDQISTILNDNLFDPEAEEVTATVLFTLNSEQEIVVLSVQTEHKDVEAFVKGKLNYKKVSLNDFSQGKQYVLPVRITG